MRSCFAIVGVSFLVAMQSLGQSSSLAEGLELFRQGRYQSALLQFQASEQSQPPSAIIENLLGLTETKLGDIRAADQYYNAAIRIAPEASAPYKNLGFNELNAKDYTAAERNLKKALMLSPQDKFVHYYLGILYLATSQDKLAVEQLDQADSLVDNDPKTALATVKACIATRQIDKAIPLIQSLEERSAISDEDEYRVATLMSASHYYLEAVERFKRLTKVEPLVWVNKYNLAIAMLDAGENSQALPMLQELANRRPKDANVLSLLGAAEEGLGKLTQALDSYQAAIRLDPENQDRYLDYSRLLIEMNRYDEAVNLIQQGEKTVSDSYVLQLRLGVVQMMQGNYSAAREIYRRCMSEHPEIVLAYIALAQTYMKQANNVEAAVVLKRSKERFPNDFMVEYFSGLVASRLGKNEDALLTMRAAARLKPEMAEPHFQLGKLLLRFDRLIDSKEEFEKATNLDPEMAAAYYELSRVCARLGEKKESSQFAERSRQLMQAQRELAVKSQLLRFGSFRAGDKSAAIAHSQ